MLMIDVSEFDTILSNFKINCAKLILQLKIFSPSSRMERDINEFILIICSIIKNDELDNIANISNLKIN